MAIAVEAFVSFFVATTLSTSADFVRSMISLSSPRRKEAGGKSSFDGWADRGFGGLVAAMLVGMAIAAYTSAIYSDRVVRLLAYGLDFGYAKKYPLVDHARRMRLLDNQYAAYAKFKDWDVEFAVVKLVEEPTANKH